MTNRPSVPALDSILGQAIPVLDKGFIRVIDYMGDDAAIVQAARVSYGKGTKQVNQDKALINYLMKHWHSSPFEMCLSGDTRVQTFPCEGATVKHYTMKELSDAFSAGGKNNAWVKLVKIRTVNPDTGVVTATKIKKAWKTGVKKVYEITTEEPYLRKIKVTDNHPILTNTGFKSLQDGLSVGDYVMHNGRPALDEEVLAEINRRRDAGETIQAVAEALCISPSTVHKHSPRRVKRKTGFLKKKQGTHSDPRSIARRKFILQECEVVGCGKKATDRHHIDENPHNNELNNLSGLCAKHHRHIHTFGKLEKTFPAKIKEIKYVGEEEVYDLEVEDPNHTFVAEGLVVHNCEIKLHVKLPIFVARQWIRHRTANVNEYSARYSILDKEFYLPEPSVVAQQSAVNNQGRDTTPLHPEDAQKVIRMLEEDALRNYNTYEILLEDDRVARELARMNLTLNYYTQWYWKTDLHNLLHFLMLRADSHAQYEIRAYAEAILDVVRNWVPHTYEAFVEHRLESTRLSKTATETLQKMLSGENVTQESSGLGKREWNELVKKFAPDLLTN